MPDTPLPPELAITLAEYRRHNLRRPLTDDPIGGNAGSIIRRQNSATASRIVEHDIDPWERRNRNPETRMIQVADRERQSRARLAAKRAAEAAQCPPNERNPLPGPDTTPKPENAT